MNIKEWLVGIIGEARAQMNPGEWSEFAQRLRALAGEFGQTPNFYELATLLEKTHDLFLSYPASRRAMATAPLPAQPVPLEQPQGTRKISDVANAFRFLLEEALVRTAAEDETPPEKNGRDEEDSGK